MEGNALWRKRLRTVFPEGHVSVSDLEKELSQLFLAEQTRWKILWGARVRLRERGGVSHGKANGMLGRIPKLAVLILQLRFELLAKLLGLRQLAPQCFY